MHICSNHSPDLLFSSCKVSKVLETSLDKPVSYSVIQKQFSSDVADCNIQVGLSKVGLHCMHEIPHEDFDVYKDCFSMPG